jgi:hypothetical protein
VFAVRLAHKFGYSESCIWITDSQRDSCLTHLCTAGDEHCTYHSFSLILKGLRPGAEIVIATAPLHRITDLNVAMEDLETDEDERSVELATIAAIFPELLIDSHNPFSAKLDIPVNPAKPLAVTFSSTAGETGCSRYGCRYPFAFTPSTTILNHNTS